MTRKGRKLEPKLFLDMDFAEALERFTQTDPRELSEQLDGQSGTRGQAMDELSWTKDLSVTDAQQPTGGGIVPYLRLTKGDLKPPNEFQSWFRDTFFADADWAPGEVGREPDVEIANIVMKVSINGVRLGDKAFTVSHGANRQEKHDTPNTWLHWAPEVQEILSENDLSGCPVTLVRRSDGKYEMDIQAAKT